MKLQYSYKTYDGSREALQISRSRGEARVHYIQLLIGATILVLIGLFADFSNSWYITIPLLIACIVGFVRLGEHYDDVTDKKVACAIYKRMLERELGIKDSSTIKKMMKEFKKNQKAKQSNHIDVGNMI